jgi:hypothetical protein
MFPLGKQPEHLVYSRDNLELAEDLQAIKTATGPKRVELSRALVRRFCDFKNDLSEQGDFCGQLGLSAELTEFIFSGLRNWAEGGSIEVALSVDARPGRPPQTRRNRALFDEVRSRVNAGWDVHAACYATADALQLGDVAGVEPRVLSASSIRRIYYSVMSAADEKAELSLAPISSEAAIQGTPVQVDRRTINRANNGQWNATVEIFRLLHDAGERVLSNRYLMMVASLTGLSVDVLRHQNACLKKIVDGQSPNESYGYDSRQ